jgi:hypothetical protein
MLPATGGPFFAVNNAELRANLRKALSVIRIVRMENTTSVYKFKQKEFHEF